MPVATSLTAYLQQCVQPGIEGWVLQAMLCDQREDAVQGQDPQHASLVQAAGEEVSQQQGVGQGRHDAGVQLHQHLLQKLGGQRQPQQPQPCVTAAEARAVQL